jgi:hypothetical protein
MQLFYEHAVKEFEYFNITRDSDVIPVLSGFYQSFCQIHSSNSKRFEGIKIDSNLCDMYNGDQLSIHFSNQSVKFLIIAINFVLRILIIKLITYIGVDTESEQTRLITNGVFVVQFFNTALILLVFNANLAEQGFPLNMFSSSRGLSDFGHLWFSEIGFTITGAMLFNVFWPIVEFFVFGSMRQAFRFFDRGFSCNK